MDRGYDREFIIVDRTKLTREGDQFKDATVFYHHPTNSMAELEVVDKYSQLVGLVTLHYDWFGNFPSYIKIHPVGCAVKQLGQKYLMMLASRTEEPQEMTMEYLNVINDLFTFYHQSVSRILKLARRDWDQFIVHMEEIFATIIALVCHVPFLIPTVFHSLPYLELPKKGMPLFVSASRLLRECQLNRFVIGGLIVHNKKIVCSQLPAAIVKKLCLVAQVEYDVRHSGLVHDMSKVFKIGLEGDVALKLHNLWVLEVFLTEQEVADIKQCRANLLERSTARHSVIDNTSKRLENTRSPRPYGAWRRNRTPTFRTGMVNTAEQAVAEYGSGRGSLTSPNWILRRKNMDATPSPVQGYHIEAEPQEKSPKETTPASGEPSTEPTNNDKVDGKADNNNANAIPTARPPKNGNEGFHTPPLVTPPSHHSIVAEPILEAVEDVTPDEQASDLLSSMEARSTSTLVKSAEVPHITSGVSNTHHQAQHDSSNEEDDNMLASPLPPEDSISLATAEDGSVDGDKPATPVGLSEETSKLKVDNDDADTAVNSGVKVCVVHENGWASLDPDSEEVGYQVEAHMPLSVTEGETKHIHPLPKIVNSPISSSELHDNGVSHEDMKASENLLPVDRYNDDPTTLSNGVTSPSITLTEGDLPDRCVLPEGNLQVKTDHDVIVDPVVSGNSEDAGVSPTLSSVSCSDSHASCHSSNLYTPQTASSEVQDNEASDENDNSHLIQLCAYVQCYQDTVTILLGDSELSEDISGLEALWKKIMPTLYNMQAELKDLLNVSGQEMASLENCAVNAPFWAISYYDKCKRCKASPPVVSFQFRHAVRSCHLEYKSDPSLAQVTLWKDQGRLVSQRVKNCEHYFYPNTGLYNEHSSTHPVTSHVTMESLAKVKAKQTNKIFIL